MCGEEYMGGSNASTGKLELLHLELGSLQSVRDCVQQVLRRTNVLHVLVNNAGKQLVCAASAGMCMKRHWHSSNLLG